MKVAPLGCICCFLLSCSGSPARISSQSDAEIYEDWNKKETSEICVRYMKSITLALKRPDSATFTAPKYRLNPQLERILVERGLPSDYCYDQDLIAAAEAKLERDAQREADRQSRSATRELKRNQQKIIRAQEDAAFQRQMECMRAGGVYGPLGCL